MPEGDSVYLVARRLDAALGRQVLGAGELRVPQHATADLAGRTVLANDTHGKHLLTRFYHPATLAGPQARTGWLEPDRAPFPWRA